MILRLEALPCAGQGGKACLWIRSRNRVGDTFSLRTGPYTQEEYTNMAAKLFSAFIRPLDKKSVGNKGVNLDCIDWDCNKRKKTNLKRLNRDLFESIKLREWFVTGNVEPQFFSDAKQGMQAFYDFQKEHLGDLLHFEVPVKEEFIGEALTRLDGTLLSFQAESKEELLAYVSLEK